MATRRQRQEDANSRSALATTEEVQRQPGQLSETLHQNKKDLKGSSEALGCISSGLNPSAKKDYSNLASHKIT